MFYYLLSFALYVFFFFNDTATTEIYTLSLHDALPICGTLCTLTFWKPATFRTVSLSRASLNRKNGGPGGRDRKSTRLNSSHGYISYAVFCLKKKKKKN